MAPLTSQDIYTPIGKREIRLVKISKSSNGTIIGELRIVSLDQRPKVRFTALSYVCGTGNHHKRIRLNGILYEVYRQLYPFLQRIADHANSPDWPRWLWIDSLCINQNDLDERSAQVTNMGTIYENAHSTMIWLGDTSRENAEDVATAISFIHELSEKRFRLKGKTSRKKEIGGEDKELIDEMRGKWAQWKAFERFLSRNWFRRVWTLQELILTRAYKFYCGKHSISMQHWKRAIYAAFVCRCDRGLIAGNAWNSAWDRRRIWKAYTVKRPMPLISLLAYLGDHKATNPRDRIYSLLGLIPSRDKKMVACPDYRAETEAVYTKLVKSFVETHNSLDIICFAQNFRPQSKGDRSLPSWVPDWRVHTSPRGVPYMVSQGSRHHIGNFRPVTSYDSPAEYRASGSSRPVIKGFSVNNRELTCQGVLLDTIDGLGALTDLSLEQSTSATNTRRNPEVTVANTYPILSDIAHCLVLDRGDRYLCHYTPANFPPDFLCACIAATYFTSTEVTPDFTNWYDRNKTLRIYGTSLQEIMKSVNRRPSLFDTCAQALAETKRKASSSPLSHLLDIDEYFTSFVAVAHNTHVNLRRRLMVTDKGNLGMGPAQAQKGDIVVVLFGCSVPVVLRELWSGSGQKSIYEFIGEAYVHGYMGRGHKGGELLREMELGKRKPENFCMV